MNIFNFPVKSTPFTLAAWDAAEAFRSVVDSFAARDYILAIFFLKYLSDFEKVQQGQSGQEFNESGEQDGLRPQPKRFTLPPGCDFDTLYERRNEPYLGEIINSILKAIEAENSPKLKGIFRHLDFNSDVILGSIKERNKLLRRLIESFADESLNLRPTILENPQLLRDTFEGLMLRFASACGKKGNEFYTPAEVALLLAKLLQPKPGDRICDPACGSGSLLLRVAKEVQGEDCTLFGQELNRATWALCKMNMLIHGKDEARIEWGDTLTQPKLIEDDKLIQFDIVASTLPLFNAKWDASKVAPDKFGRFYRGIPTGSRSDFAFITHMIETAVAATGKVGVIVPHGALFRGGVEKKIRQALIEENLLEAVVGLSAHLFYGTPIPVVILLFNRRKSSSNVIFVDASGVYIEGTDLNRKKLYRLKVSEIDEVVSLVKNQETRPNISQPATLEQIAANDFDLSLSHYIDTSAQMKVSSNLALQGDLAKLEQELDEVRSAIDKYLTALQLPLKRKNK